MFSVISSLTCTLAASTWPVSRAGSALSLATAQLVEADVAPPRPAVLDAARSWTPGSETPPTGFAAAEMDFSDRLTARPWL
jgi:hypothetical protein